MVGYICNRLLNEDDLVPLYKKIFPDYETKKEELLYGPLAGRRDLYCYNNMSELVNELFMKEINPRQQLRPLQHNTLRKYCVSAQRAVTLANIIGIGKFQKTRLKVDVFRDFSIDAWKLAVYYLAKEVPLYQSFLKRGTRSIILTDRVIHCSIINEQLCYYIRT